MADRMRFVLDGDDRLTRVLNSAGDSAARLHRRLADASEGGARAMRQFTGDTNTRLRDLQSRFTSAGDSADGMGTRMVAAARRLLGVADASVQAQRGVATFTTDANGRLHDLRGRFVSASNAAQAMAGGMPVVARRLGDVASAGGNAAGALGSSGGGLSGVMLGVAAAAGVSLLPALGALVPMMAGGALAAVTLKLGFAGVGDAMEAAGKGKEEYAEALKKLSPEARSFTEELVGMKKEFAGVGKDVQKAMLPGFTRALKDAAPAVKILGKNATEMGAMFGEAAEGVGRLLKDSGFQDDLQTNLKLGTQFMRDMTSAMGPFTRSLLDFGAASGPTLKSFSDGIGGLLSKGLPDMFDGLKTGIPGTAQMLDGLFDSVNSLLGGIGRLGGEAGRTLGPLFGETFKVGGDLAAGAMDGLRGVLVVLRPVIKDVGFGLKTIRDVGAIVGPTLKDAGLGIASAFLPIGESVDRAVGPLQRLNLWVADNKVAVLEAARVFGVAMIDMTSAAITAAPTIIGGFRLAATGVLTALDAIVSGGAKAFGWVPGIGDKLKAANRDFDRFKEGFLNGLSTAEKKASDFAASSAPKLAAGKLKLNINNWQSQIEAAKAKMKSLPPEKQAALKATIRDLQAKVDAAKRKLGELKDKTVTGSLRDRASAQARAIQRAIDAIRGKSVDIYTVRHTINVGATAGRNNRNYGATGGLYTGSASGFKYRGYARGGLVDGPGTETSDDVYAPWLSKNEFVVNARRTREHLPLLKAINSGGLASGSTGSGGTAGAGMDAGRGLAAGLKGSTSLVQGAARIMAASVTAGISEELQISSPSKKTKALMADVGKGMIVGLTGSQAKIKATAKDLAADIWKAFDGSKDNRLVAMVNRETKKLLALAAKRDKVAATIATAKKYAGELTSSARESAGLGNLGMEPEQVTAGGIKAGLASKLSQIRTFTRYIDILAKKGLNKGLLRQILNMGPEAGYAYASALVGADKATFNQINSLQTQLDKSTTNLGRVGADRMYDSGKNASKGFLTGLLSQEKELEKAMEKIAKAMQKSLRNALGIKSPATKMMPDGENTTKGVAVGVIKGMPFIDQAMDTVAGRIAGRTVAAPVASRAAVVAGRRGGGDIHIHVDGAVVDALGFARAAREALLELKRTNGGGDLGLA
ncbi:hypothetical protein CLM62_12885 [Streptomyces sp. SA15]|uniref:cell envelope integrity protein TolA n=1 Tax=Streptomyces sp. SA15 TaxID=934019 RepID=UPI000BB061F4|nr:cell envelope integrity protein TolA [Streptomyces sp. SA15]PAZ15686.1 hypothetical protein CLM62_12885 [Streptomyces sp. SA15]